MVYILIYLNHENLYWFGNQTLIHLLWTIIYIFITLTKEKVQQLQGEKESLSLDLINSQAMCSDLQQKLNEEMAARQPMVVKVCFLLFSFSPLTVISPLFHTLKRCAKKLNGGDQPWFWFSSLLFLLFIPLYSYCIQKLISLTDCWPRKGEGWFECQPAKGCSYRN